MGSKGAQERERGSAAKELHCRIAPETDEWLRSVAEQHSVSLGRVLDWIARTAPQQRKKNA